VRHASPRRIAGTRPARALPALALAAALHAAGTAAAQPAPPATLSAPAPAPLPHAPTSLPISVTVGGGVSLGAYQAGLLYYVSETAKLAAEKAESREAPAPVSLVVATGASAGSVNALITLVGSCSARVENPEESPFWQTWIPLGFDRVRGEVGAEILGPLAQGIGPRANPLYGGGLQMLF
jgi:hypothetical protein